MDTHKYKPTNIICRECAEAMELTPKSNCTYAVYFEFQCWTVRFRPEFKEEVAQGCVCCGTKHKDTECMLIENFEDCDE